MAFVVGSYQAVEHPGGGHRASMAGLWRGEDLRTLNDVAMTVLPVEHAGVARREVALAASVRHPHLLPVIDVVQDEDRVAVVCPWPAGGRLAELVLRRGRLSANESLTVLRPLAAALVAGHAAGISHGGICPETIWFDAHGRPLLGAPAVSRIIASLNDGLPAGSRDVAPEVVRAERVPADSVDDGPLTGGPITHGTVAGRTVAGGSLTGGLSTTAADVFSLGSVALFCLTGRSAWPADDPADVLVQSAAGLWPDLPDDAGPTELIAVIREMLREEPGRRPSAASLESRVARAGDPEPILFSTGPTPTPASADRWRGWSATAPDGVLPNEGSPSGVSPDVGSPSEASGGEGPLDAVHDAAAETTPAPVRSAQPVDRRKRPLARAGIALLAGLLVTLVAVQVGAWWSGWDQPGSASIESAVGHGVSDPAGHDPGAVDGVGPSWSDVIIGLDAARGRALDAADPALLADVYVDSTSGVGAADVAVVTQLADNGLRVVDGVHQIVSVALADPNPATAGQSTGDSAEEQVRLAVVDLLPSHPVVDASGRQVGLTPSRPEQRRILVLSSTSNGYRISSIEAG